MIAKVAEGPVDWLGTSMGGLAGMMLAAQPLTPIDGAVFASQLSLPGLGFAPEAERLREFASAALPVKEFSV